MTGSAPSGDGRCRCVPTCLGLKRVGGLGEGRGAAIAPGQRLEDFCFYQNIICFAIV